MNLRERWRFYIIAAMVLVIYIGALDRQIRLSKLPVNHGLEALTFPVTVNGDQAGSLDEIRFIVQRYVPGTPVQVASRNEVRTVVLEFAVSTFYLIVTITNGLLFWVVSVLVFASRMDKVPAPQFFWACLLYGMAVMIGAIYFPQGKVWVGVSLSAIRIIALVLLPALLLHVSLSFPLRRKVLDQMSFFMPMVYLVGIAFALWQVITLLVYVLNPQPRSWNLLYFSNFAGKLYLMLVFSVGCIMFYDTHRRTEQAREKEQARWIMWGITVGTAPFVFFRTLPGVWNSTYVLPIEIARLFSIVVPAAFSFAVIRHKFLDIDIIIRRSLIYPLLASVMVGIYLILGVLVGHQVAEVKPGWSELIQIVATLVPVALFNPTRRVIGLWVDRTFFKIRYNYQQALDGYSSQVNDVATQHQLAERLRRFLQATLDPKEVAVILRFRDQRFVAGSLDPALAADAFDCWAPFFDGESPLVGVTRITSLSEIERGDLPVPYTRAGYRLFQWIALNRQWLGMVFLGEKRNERRYIEQDMELLARAAELTAGHLDRMNLTQEVAEEAIARNRLDEMNRYKTEFFSQVAHDLRSPLTSISWSARNLLDGILGPLTEKQKEYLSGIDASASQLVRLMNNLLEITRMETSSIQIETSPVQLGEVLQEAIVPLMSIALSNDIQIKLMTDGELPPIRGHRGKLREIIDNLVENAMRYSQPHSSVEVTLTPCEGDAQRLAVRDHGPGIAQEDFEKIFESYYQGKSSPYATQMGFGLGLRVVKTYVELMGGKVAVCNHPEGGALFECIFPNLSQSSGEHV